MRSFAITAFATLAFGLFCSAAPTPHDDGLVKVDADVNAYVGVDVRSADDKCLGSILSGVVSSLEPIVEEITSLTVLECTVEKLEPIIAEVKDILVCAIGDLKGLEGLDIGSILKSVLGLVLDLDGVAGLLCSIIKAVVEIVKCILAIVTADVKGVVLPLLLELISLVVELLSCVLSLVGGVLEGLLSCVVKLLGDVVTDILDLKLTALINILCL